MSFNASIGSPYAEPENIEECFENLANAIVLKACSDYRAALRNVKRYPRDPMAKSAAYGLERFFYSEWFATLTKISPDDLIARLKEDVGVAE